MSLHNIVFRWAVVAGVVLAGFLGGASELDPLLVLVAVSALCMDFTAPASARNIVVLYHLLVLGVGPLVLPMPNGATVQWFGVALVTAYLVGNSVAAFFRRLTPTSDRPHGRPHDSTIASRLPAAVGVLRVATALQAALVAADVLRFGLERYLGGAALTARLTGFAAGGLSGLDIVKDLVGVIVVSCVAAHVALNEPQRKYAWRHLLLVMVGMPLLQFDRSALIANVIALLFLRRAASFTRGAALGGRFLVVTALTVSLVVALGIGMLRHGALTNESPLDAGAASVLVGEISPVLVVSDALSPSAPRFGGEPIIGALVTRYVPRAVYPDKPLNTAGRWMSERDPAAFKAGYSIAPTAVGTLLLNFGVAASLFLALLVGAGMRILSTLRESPTAVACIMYFSIFTLLRDDVSSSAAYALVCYLGYRAIIIVSLQRELEPSLS